MEFWGLRAFLYDGLRYGFQCPVLDPWRLADGRPGRLRDVWKNLLRQRLWRWCFGLIFLFSRSGSQRRSEPVRMIGSMNTPLAMIIAGANLAQGDVRKKSEKYPFVLDQFLKLVLSPLIGLGILFFMRVDFTGGIYRVYRNGMSGRCHDHHVCGAVWKGRILCHRRLYDHYSAVCGHNSAADSTGTLDLKSIRWIWKNGGSAAN